MMNLIKMGQEIYVFHKRNIARINQMYPKNVYAPLFTWRQYGMLGQFLFLFFKLYKLSKYSFQNKDRVKMSFNFLCVITILVCVDKCDFQQC